MFPTFLTFTERHPRYVTLLGFSIIAMGLVLYGFEQIRENHREASPVTRVAEVLDETPEETPKSFPEPTKTEFKEALPTDFPIDIPVEKDAKFTQSYILDYPGQKQLSIVFSSMKTVKENYALYSDYAKKEGWTLSNKEEKDNLSFLYATKENMDMNVTITESISTLATDIPLPGSGTNPTGKPIPSSKSQVSLSVLRK